MKPPEIQAMEALLQCEIQETDDLKNIYAARTGPLSSWGEPMQSVFYCNENREVIGLNLSDEEAIEEIDEEDIFDKFPVLPQLQILNLSRTGTYYYTTDAEDCKQREDHPPLYIYIDIFPYLEKLPNLHTFIHMGNKKLRCACFLPNLPTLTHLYLNYNNIRNVNWLGNLEHIEYLDLRANVIQDIEPLRHLKKLKHLYLGSPSHYKRQNKITDISALAELTELESLDLDFNDVQNLSLIKNFPKLKSLSLNSMPSTKDFNIISDFINLEQLELIDNKISYLDFLSPLQNLAYLDISYNAIKSLKPLAQLTNLTYLRMYNCHLSSHSLSEVFQNLHKLTRLDISRNSLKDISWLSNMPLLEKLDLENNLVADLSVLRSLPKLKKLNLFNNPISDLSVLTSLPDLEELSVNTKYLPYPPVWYVYLKVKKGQLRAYSHLSEPPFIEKIWLLLSSKDNTNLLLAKELALGQGWSEEMIEVYLEYARKYY